MSNQKTSDKDAGYDSNPAGDNQSEHQQTSRKGPDSPGDSKTNQGVDPKSDPKNNTGRSEK